MVQGGGVPTAYHLVICDRSKNFCCWLHRLTFKCTSAVFTKHVCFSQSAITLFHILNFTVLGFLVGLKVWSSKHDHCKLLTTPSAWLQFYRCPVTLPPTCCNLVLFLYHVELAFHLWPAVQSPLHPWTSKRCTNYIILLLFHAISRSSCVILTLS